MTTITKTMKSQTYYAECICPDDEHYGGLRMSVTLTTTEHDQQLPEIIPDFTCFSVECPHGGTHDLEPIPDALAESLMAERD